MKRYITLLLVFIMIITALTSCGMLKDKLAKLPVGDDPEEVESVEVEDIETAESLTEPLESESTEVAPSLDLGGYVGNWHPMSREGEAELRIAEAANGRVVFSLWYADGAELNNVTASLSGDKASFDMEDSENSICGELIFGDSFIKLRVDDTNVSFFDVGLTVFDGRHQDLYKEKQTEAEPEYRPTVVEPTAYIRPYAQYVNTPDDILNLREGPSINYAIICELSDGTEVKVHGYNDDGEWAYVYYDLLDVYGWCHSAYLVF